VSSHLETANLFLAAGDLQHALKQQLDALRLDNHNTEALTAAGEISFELRDYTKARQYLKAALEEDPTSQKTRNELVLTEMMVDNDPLAPRLSNEERQSRLVRDLNRSLQRLDACLSQTPSPQMSGQLQSLKAEALAIGPTLNSARHRPDYDTVKSGIGLILRIQKAATNSCGEQSPFDEALLLIALEHNGGQQ
jgi:tetratricopeptide (TPR) repeat protein